MKKILSIHESSQFLGFKSISQIKTWLKWQRVPFVEVGHYIFFKRGDLKVSIESILLKVSEKRNHPDQKCGSLYCENTNKSAHNRVFEKQFFEKLINNLH